MSYTNQLGAIYLNNTAGAVTPGGDPTVGALTPFSIKAGWTPASVEPDPAFASYFRRDRVWLWLLAIGLPFAITGVFRLLAMVAA